MNNNLLRIGEIAGFFNVSVKAIRIYEKMDIIKPAKIDEKTGYRYYTADQVQQLDALIELKQLGFSLMEIKRLLNDDMTNEKLIQALNYKKQSWQTVIINAENKIRAIDNITENISGSEQAAKAHEMTDEERAWLMAKLICAEDLRGQNVLSEQLWL